MLRSVLGLGLPQKKTRERGDRCGSYLGLGEETPILASAHDALGQVHRLGDHRKLSPDEKRQRRQSKATLKCLLVHFVSFRFGVFI